MDPADSTPVLRELSLQADLLERHEEMLQHITEEMLQHITKEQSTLLQVVTELQVTLLSSLFPCCQQALIDSGAEQSFVDEKNVKLQKLKFNFHILIA